MNSTHRIYFQRIHQQQKKINEIDCLKVILMTIPHISYKQFWSISLSLPLCVCVWSKEESSCSFETLLLIHGENLLQFFFLLTSDSPFTPFLFYIASLQMKSKSKYFLCTYIRYEIWFCLSSVKYIS